VVTEEVVKAIDILDMGLSLSAWLQGVAAKENAVD